MSGKKITYCLWFDGQAEDAAQFYISVFKNTLQGKISRYGKEGFEVHKQPEGRVLVMNFSLNGIDFIALNGGPHFKFNQAVSFFVTCTTLDETNEIWNKLVAGGKALMPIDKYPWSERYGWVQDRFGLSWQVSVNSESPEQKIAPCLLFIAGQFGRAEDAINFYSGVFNNASTEILIHYPEGDANAGKVMYSTFTLDQNAIIAMDGPGVHDYTFNEAVSFSVSCDTQEEIDHYWNMLSAGGQEGLCGWLKDKFGVSWQIVPSILGTLMSNPEKSGKVMKAFLQMKKFEIKKLLEA